MLLCICGCRDNPSSELSDLLDRVEKLNISRKGYTLGKQLTRAQIEIAKQYPVALDNPGQYKFRDDNIHVVAHKKTDRVLIAYEHHDNVFQQQAQDIVGSLFMDFGDPTVFSHGKVIYWAYDHEGNLSREAYQNAKNDEVELDVLATIKLNSSMELATPATAEGQIPGSVYYVISSPPLLKLINNEF